MKAFMAVFMLSWIIGAALGAIEATSPAGIFIIAAAAGWYLAAPLFRLRLQYTAAALCLGILGVVWGQASAVDVPPCSEGNLAGVITEVYSREESRSQYVFNADGGCSVLVTASRFPEYNAGDRLELAGKIQPVSEIPEEYAGYAKYLHRQGIAATVRYPRITVIHSPAGNPAPAAARIAARIKKIFLEPESSVVTAMLIGERGGIPERVDEQLRRSGVSHILAISGLHVSLLIGLVLVLAYALPIPASIRTVLVAALLWSYIILLGFPPSATRAALFWTAALLALQARALVSLPVVLLFAVFIMISVNPQIVHNAGFQLSAAAVAGIGLALFLTRPWNLAGWKRWVLNVFLVSLGAALATWPITAVQFGSVSIIGAAANVLVVPVMPALLASAVLALLFSYGAVPVAATIAYIARLLWLWIDFITSLLGSAPLAALEDVSIPWWIVPGYYGCLLVAAAYILRRQKRMWLEVFE